MAEAKRRRMDEEVALEEKIKGANGPPAKSQNQRRRIVVDPSRESLVVLTMESKSSDISLPEDSRVVRSDKQVERELDMEGFKLSLHRDKHPFAEV